MQLDLTALQPHERQISRTIASRHRMHDEKKQLSRHMEINFQLEINCKYAILVEEQFCFIPPY